MKNELITDIEHLDETEGGASKLGRPLWDDSVVILPPKGGGNTTMKWPSDNDNGDPFLFNE